MFFFCILKQIMYSKIYNFLISFLRRHLRAGYITEVQGQIQPTPHFLCICVYYIIQFDVHDLATY